MLTIGALSTTPTVNSSGPELFRAAEHSESLTTAANDSVIKREKKAQTNVLVNTSSIVTETPSARQNNSGFDTTVHPTKKKTDMKPHFECFRRRPSKTFQWCRFLFIVAVWSAVAVQWSSADNLALLSGTLRTIQRAACDGESLTLRCPLGTAVSIQLAQYGRPAPGVALCSGGAHSSTLPAVIGSSNKNDSCAITPQMQHSLLQTVVEACVKKRSCKFSTSSIKSSSLSDSSPSAVGENCLHQPPKFVEVAYKCRPLEFRSKIICENETIQLKCKRNARIAIYSASFGRVQFQSLQCPQPAGVDDETCEASFSTETVMQMCHGKRRCTLNASASTFGNPCSAQSHLYLRVVYTCVSRRILKDHYQGELEEDESVDQALDNDESAFGESSFESDDYAEQAISSAATPTPPRHSVLAGNNLEDDNTSNDHPANYRTTSRPAGPVGDQAVKRPGFFGDSGDVLIDDGMLGDIGEDDGDDYRRRHHFAYQPRPTSIGAPTNTKGGSGSNNVFGLISEWITSVSFMKENQEKFILYLTLSIAAGILVLLTLLIGRLWWQKRRAKMAKAVHSSDPIPAFADDLSDVDNDIDLTSLALPPPPPLLTELTSLNGGNGPVPTSEGVRGYATGTIRRPVDEIDTHPRSFARNGNNSHYYYG